MVGVGVIALPCAVQESWHFIGIGGIGMSALAYLLALQGARVTGSDLKPNLQTERLGTLGVEIFFGHRAENLQSADQGQRVVYSTAIDPANPEFVLAQQQCLPLLHRAEVLAHIAQGYQTIGISGTHGKTTTTSMIGCLLADQNLDPTVLVGGEVTALGGNARWGKGHYLVAEVDESDGSLVLFHPRLAVITNIEADHLDHYQDLAAIVTAFQQFSRQSEEIILCLDCPNITRYLLDQPTPWTGYSLHGHPQARYTVGAVTYAWDGTTAEILDRGQLLGTLKLQLTAPHNLSNSLAAVAIGRQLGLDFEQIAQSLGKFQGAQRRFQKYGEYGGVLYIDDYAHHPSEIRATLASAKLSGRRVVAIFQPHRYSRTVAFFEEFATCFDQADVVVLTDIYGCGEANPQQISGQDLAVRVAQVHPEVHYGVDLVAIQGLLPQILQRGDIALFLGAGNLNSIIPQLLLV